MTLVVPCMAVWPVLAAPTPEQIKAVMIRKFVEFVKWPDAVSPRNEMLVKICVYGNSSMSAAREIFEKVGANQAVRYSFSTLSQISAVPQSCHVVFISSEEQGNMGSIMGGLKGKPVLTISDMSGFADKGGMIGFNLVDGKVRYDINNRAFGAAELSVDAQLLETANKVVE